MAKPTPHFDTLADIFGDAVDMHATQTAFIFLDGGGAEVARLSYGEARRRSRTFAAGLQAELEPGDCVVLALPTAPDLVVAFYGSLLAGVLPVLCTAPRHRRDRHGEKRLQMALAQAGAKRLVVTPEGSAALNQFSLPAGCKVIAGVEQLSADEGLWRRPAVSASSPAYLQLTSGSTARPHLVALSHENVLSNLETIRCLFDDDEMRGVSWLPPYHDMGLVGHLLEPAYNEGLSVLAPPGLFARDPLNWLKAVSRYRATSSGAPPFAYAQCARRAASAPADLDLSSWKNAYVGSEQIWLEVLEEFARAFAPYGFDRGALLPCYGLAEATLYVAGNHLSEGTRLKARSPEMGAALTGYVLTDPELEVRIVEPESGRELPAGEVGEVCLRGPSVALNYYGDEEATRAAFLPSSDGARALLHTGDLGFLDGDALYIAGRLKDLVIVRGVNYHPVELEASAAASHELLRHLPAACFSVEGRETEGLVVIQEVGPARREEWPEVIDAVRDAIADEHGIQPSAIVLVRRGTLPRTTSGKVSRSQCREAYAAGTLRREAAWGSVPPAHVATAEASKPQRHETDPPAGNGAAEPIAVVGVACKFPGGADDPEALWTLLAEGVDAISETPPDRWDPDLFYDPRPAVPGKMNTRWGGFLQGVGDFDAEFFGIAAHEAAEIDPQQRLLLEVAWRAFESAGLTAERLSGSDTGVFVGISTNDYLHLQIKLKPGMEYYNAYSGLGNANSISANRISYVYDLRGPSMAVDTACSSSMTALHLAVQSLRRGECAAAIAGGVNLILSPGSTVTLSQFGMMAPDGRCKVFDSRADGYVRSEGCGLVVLKRKSDALRDGDHVLAYILGTALNQDGRSLGITAPNPEAQREVILRALADAACEPDEVTLVEAHGTGTAAGDPAEFEQLSRIYGRTNGGNTCYLGAVKASLGHLEAAAGVAGVIKLVLALGRGEVPPQLHLRQLNPRIALEGSRFVIPRERVAWPSNGVRRLAAVSSFGFGGANGHAILEAAARAGENGGVREDEDRPVLLPLSAKSRGALVELARTWVRYLKGGPGASLASVCYAQATRRSHFDYRAAFVARTRAEMIAKLEAFASDTDASRGGATSSEGVAFLFSGQGSQYAGMGRALYERFKPFRDAFDLCAAAYAKCANAEGPTLREVAFSDNASRIDDTLYLQPAQFAVEYALTRLLAAANVEPSALLGHSLGEYVAACVAGCFGPEEAMRLVTERARLMASVARAGRMAAAAAEESRVRALLESGGFKHVSIAAVNAPESVVVSGPAEELEAAARHLESQGVAVKGLKTSQAFHSSLMDEVLDEFERAAAGVSYGKPTLTLVSNLTGEELGEAPDARYWRRHLRECVQFKAGVETLVGDGLRTFVEVGPGGALLALARRCASGERLTLLPACGGGGADEVATLLEALGVLYASGARINWRGLSAGKDLKHVPGLPVHPFRRRRHWFSSDEMPGSQPAEAEAKTRSKSPLSGWGYHLRWVPSDTQEPAAPARADEEVHWIIVGDGSGMAEELARSLPAPRGQIFRISYDASITAEHAPRRTAGRETGVSTLLVPPGCGVEGYARVLNLILTRLSRADVERWNVLYLRGTDCASETSVESLERDQRLHAAGDFAAFAQAAVGTARVLRTWVVTTNAQPVHVEGRPTCDDVLNLAQSTLWGFAHTLFLEHPEMRGGAVDLEAGGAPTEQAARVISQVTAGVEAFAAFRGGLRYVPRLTPTSFETPAQPVSFRRDGTYLVTGGLGGIGLVCARWLAERGAGHIILLARTPLPPPEKRDSLEAGSDEHKRVEAVRAIERAGATVEVVVADVTDHARVAEVVRGVAAAGRELRGVVHAAGVNWFGKVAQLDPERLTETLRVKVSATWNLHELTRESELDFFLLFSSVSALWGSVDLAHYTAANLFLDALAYERRRAGLPCLSIDWGPWAKVGMSARSKEVKLLGKLGFRLMAPQRTLALTESLLAADETRAVVADIDWRKFQAFVNFSTSPAFFERVSAGAGDSQASAESARAEAERIRSAPPDEARALLVALVRRHLAAVLLLDLGREVSATRRFNMMGMDSLMAIALALRLEQIAGSKLPTTLAYNYPTIQDVADYLYEAIRKERPPGGEVETATVEAPPAPPEHRRWFPSLSESAGASFRLFCVPQAGAGASAFNEWPEAFASLAETVAVQLPGREERAGEEPIRDLTEAARRLVDALAELTPAPFVLFGHSMGGLIAFEAARELRRRGMPAPQRLFLSACGAPLGDAPEQAVHTLPEEELKQFLLSRLGAPEELVSHASVWESVSPLLRADIGMLETYAPPPEPPLDLPLTVFGGADDRYATRQRLLEWGAYTSGDFSIRLFPGGHGYLRDAKSRLWEAVRRELSQAITQTTARKVWAPESRGGEGDGR